MSRQTNYPLPTGFRLGEYLIERQISLGGFSIVYLAVDDRGEFVAIKEYLPNSLALRGEGKVRPEVPEEHLQTFAYGMKCFFEEGRALAALSHPNVIRVLNFFRANDTVYMVMEYERGRTLQEFIKEDREAITENFIRNVFTKLLNGLREAHSHKLLHLDIKPANIYMRNDYIPVLIDFGAARQKIGAARQHPGIADLKVPESDAPIFKSMYTPGFAPPEYYGRRDQLGPWSDIYSIGATMYACLAGAAPQAADNRLEKDKVVSAVVRWNGLYSDHLLETIDRCLRLDPLERPQTAFALQKALTTDVNQDRAASGFSIRPMEPDDEPPENPAGDFMSTGGRLKQKIGLISQLFKGKAEDK